MMDRPPPTPSRAPLCPVRHVVPLIPAAGEITPEVERLLVPLAQAARAGDRDARDALWRAFAPKLDRLAAAALRRAQPDARAAGLLRDNRHWDAEDLTQDAFLILADLLLVWPGDGPISPFLLSHLSWRLRSAARALTTRRRFEASAVPLHLRYLADDSAAAAEAAVLLDMLAAELPPPDGDILLRHVRDGDSLGAIAHQLALSRRTVTRHWHAIKRGLRTED